MKYALMLLIAVLVTACASTQPPEPRIAQTPSGMPEATFSDITPEQTLASLAKGCVQTGWNLRQHDAYSVTCARPTTLNEALQILTNIGTWHSSDPVINYRFEAMKQGDATYVHCTIIASTTRPNGVEDSMLWTSNRDFNAVQGTFIKLGGH